MKTALLLIAPGFEEIEAVTICDVLRRGNINVTMAGLAGIDVCGAHNITIKTDCLLEEQEHNLFDAIILPGGLGGTENLLASEATTTILKNHAEAGKLVTAICAAPWVLAEAGVLGTCTATIYPGLEDKLPGTCGTASVIVDGKIITAKGPATAMEFGLVILKQLAGEETQKEVGQGLLYFSG